MWCSTFVQNLQKIQTTFTNDNYVTHKFPKIKS